LGHDVYSAIVEELSGMAKSMTIEKLRKLQLTAEQLRSQAMQNLAQALKSGVIGSTEFPKGPRDKPFILVGGHWAASACCLLSLMPDLARQRLGSKDVCFSVPHTEALLLFGKGDRGYRDEMRALIREKESDGRKRLTWELFEYMGETASPLVEDTAD
jgi:hypothetical protein